MSGLLRRALSSNPCRQTVAGDNSAGRRNWTAKPPRVRVRTARINPGPPLHDFFRRYMLRTRRILDRFGNTGARSCSSVRFSNSATRLAELNKFAILPASRGQEICHAIPTLIVFYSLPLVKKAKQRRQMEKISTRALVAGLVDDSEQLNAFARAGGVALRPHGRGRRRVDRGRPLARARIGRRAGRGRAGRDRPDDLARGADFEFLYHNRGRGRGGIVHRTGTARGHVNGFCARAGGGAGGRRRRVRRGRRGRVGRCRRGSVRRGRGRGRSQGLGLAHGPAQTVRGHPGHGYRAGRAWVVGLPGASLLLRGRSRIHAR